MIRAAGPLSRPKIVPRGQWIAAGKALLAKEQAKQGSVRSDALFGCALTA
jgi:hypothetical protein